MLDGIFSSLYATSVTVPAFLLAAQFRFCWALASPWSTKR